MSTQSAKTVGGSKYAGMAVLFVALCGCASLPPTSSVAIPKIPTGMARAWFYRQDEPYTGFDRSYVRMNGAIVGISELGGAFYHDVPPGPYYITADTYRQVFNQFPHVALLPGDTAYFQVFEMGSGAGAWRNYARPTFSIWVMPAAIGAAEVGRSAFYAGGG
jgi:hypothetical protein